MTEEEESKQNQQAAKQAIAPNALRDMSAEGESGGPGAKFPDEDVIPQDDTDDMPTVLKEQSFDSTGHPDPTIKRNDTNRNVDKPQLDKPSYGGGH
ncbi:hypothetical protein [Tellurirhabdus rosea]|uniref:hypothetical protein n=1 Tax=Tellurirhabdus rosea TaxID=2674997 RepID=UPI00224F7EB6|nr:hypothetical protein [Tellurirhabdus rosea]